MKYYILDTSTAAKNTAIIDCYEPNYYTNYNNDSEFAQQNLSMWEFPSTAPIFSKLIFKRGYRIVDFIYPSTMGGCGLIISERIQKIINNFDLMPNKLYQLPVYEHKGMDYNYYLLQLVTSRFDYSMIDFEKSVFYKDEMVGIEWGHKKEHLSIKNSIEYGEIIKSIKSPFIRISYSRLVLHKKPKDLFAIHNVHNSAYIISERLKLVLEQMKATGLEDFVEIEIEYNEE